MDRSPGAHGGSIYTEKSNMLAPDGKRTVGRPRQTTYLLEGNERNKDHLGHNRNMGPRPTKLTGIHEKLHTPSGIIQ